MLTWGGVAGADADRPFDSTTVNVSEFKVFNNIGHSTSFVRSDSAFSSGMWSHFHRQSLIEDAYGNLYFAYGNDKQLRYAEYNSTSNTWSDSLIDTRQKSVQLTSMVIDSTGNKWALTNDYDRTALYNGVDDAGIYKYTGTTWNKATDLYVGRGDEAAGPVDLAKTMIKDAGNNLHVLFHREPWFSYGYAAKEMIYNTGTSA
ncbi:hypothetical protein MBAV_000679, partial [Candidatus Magnetobacterium bavaricum]